MIKKQKKNPKGFTIAEALIMLGFVSAALLMAIPVLKVGYEKASLKNAWKDDFSAIESALSNQTDQRYQGVFTDFSNNSNPQNKVGSQINEIKTGLKISKYCVNSLYVCGVSPAVPIGRGKDNIYKTLSNEVLDYDDFSGIQMLLNNGANLYLRMDETGVINIWVDVNGYLKGPNRLGRDLFGAIIIGSKVLPMGIVHTSVGNGLGRCGPLDKYIPLGSSRKAVNYAGATCSTTVLLED